MRMHVYVCAHEVIVMFNVVHICMAEEEMRAFEASSLGDPRKNSLGIGDLGYITELWLARSLKHPRRRMLAMATVVRIHMHAFAHVNV